jgi:hypothetical protein
MLKSPSQCKYVLRDWVRKHFENNADKIVHVPYVPVHNSYVPPKVVTEDMDWNSFCRYPNLTNTHISFMEKNLEKVCWESLSANLSPFVMPLLERNLDKVSWRALSWNRCPAVVHILEKNMDKLDWEEIRWNPVIFIDEYEIKCREYFNKVVTEELCKVIFHPQNLRKMKDLGFGFDSDSDCE